VTQIVFLGRVLYHSPSGNIRRQEIISFGDLQRDFSHIYQESIGQGAMQLDTGDGMTAAAEYGTIPIVLGPSDGSYKEGETMEKATFGAGCFWHVEAAFQGIPGVTGTAVGYSGGSTDHPTYREVCSGRTGHAEVLQLEYDPSRTTYEELLEIFWKIHDPTTLNRQGPDVGSQYRSAIFFHTPTQEAAARALKEKLQSSGGRFDRPVVTEIVPAAEFWKAEDYHQRYFEKTGQRSCGL
jgi:peptide-methionine (S)-S-oxide reductase